MKWASLSRKRNAEKKVAVTPEKRGAKETTDQPVKRARGRPRKDAAVHGGSSKMRTPSTPSPPSSAKREVAEEAKSEVALEEDRAALTAGTNGTTLTSSIAGSVAGNERPTVAGPPSSSTDCGNCISCADMRKFGGPGLRKQACRQSVGAPKRALLNVMNNADGESAALATTDAMDAVGSPRSEHPSGKFSHGKTYSCRMCGRDYCSPDAVRKHCRKQHPDWLRMLGQGHVQSYCTVIDSDRGAMKRVVEHEPDRREANPTPPDRLEANRTPPATLTVEETDHGCSGTQGELPPFAGLVSESAVPTVAVQGMLPPFAGLVSHGATPSTSALVAGPALAFEVGEAVSMVELTSMGSSAAKASEAHQEDKSVRAAAELLEQERKTVLHRPMAAQVMPNPFTSQLPRGASESDGCWRPNLMALPFQGVVVPLANAMPMPNAKLGPKHAIPRVE